MTELGDDVRACGTMTAGGMMAEQEDDDRTVER